MSMEDLQEFDKRSTPQWVENQTKPFFDEDEQILVHSTGNWEADLAEAERRMKQVLQGIRALSPYHMEHFADNEIGWSMYRTYRRLLWVQTYYHSHDGEDSRGEKVVVRRIRKDDFYGGLKSCSRAKFLRPNCPQEWMDDEKECYTYVNSYTGAKSVCIHNFLGMRGFFEITQERWD